MVAASTNTEKLPKGFKPGAKAGAVDQTKLNKNAAKAAADKPAKDAAAKAKPAKAPAAEKPAKGKPVAAKKEKGERTQAGYTEGQKITVKSKENPHREGTLGAKTFALLKTGMTVGEFLDACEKHSADRGYLGHWVKKEHVTIK